MIVGMTNMPEFGILPTTEPRHGGPTRNPWDTERTPGGSSRRRGRRGRERACSRSRTATTAAARSRIPAACCGLVGLKPSRGRVSRGARPRRLLPRQRRRAHPHGRRDRDAARRPRRLRGRRRDVGAAAGRAVRDVDPPRPRAPAGRDDAPTNALDADVDPECLRGMRETGELLASLGHEVVEAAPSLPGKDTLRIFTGVFGPRGRARDRLRRAARRARRPRTTRSSR